jgi:tetratricopeptide (TPR) repeat protein
MMPYCRALAFAAALCSLAACSVARAESLDAIFHAGNQAFAHADYSGAAAQYRLLVDAGIRDADVYLNLGLAQARAGALGPAILAFEQSLRIRPGDADASAALDLARSAVGKRHAQKHGEALVETRPPLAEALVRPYREDTIAWFLLVCDAVLFACLVIRRFARADATRTGFAVAAALFGLAAAASLAALVIKRGALLEGEPAIVLRDGAELREAPDPRASVRAHAQEGSSGRVLARDSGFVQVRTSAGPVGWVANPDVGLVVD